MNENNNNDNVFPKHFFWGASTAAHQVEGGTENQWSVWELAHAKELAKNAYQRYGTLHNWKLIKDKVEDPVNYVSGRGVDHYRRYREDFDLMQQLNLNALRFSVEWSRIEPKEGQWDEEAIAHYGRYIAELRSRHIEPLLNIWHTTLPVWFAEIGGFKKRANIAHYERFVSKVAEVYGSSVNYVLTMNEPNVYSVKSYYEAAWPPQEKNNLFSVGRVYINLVQAHKSAYRILKKRHAHLQIGVATQLGNIQAKRPHNMLDEFSTKIMRYLWNWWFLKRINKYQDFVGFNYYFTDYYTGLLKRENPRVPLNDMGWYMEPEGLYPLLLRTWVRFKKPIIVTENGVADSSDEYRRWWLEESIVAMERAISEGVDLRGYFHWSLLDNFEWSDGWWAKFGLIEVDREHGMARTIRPSAKWYAKRIKDL